MWFFFFFFLKSDMSCKNLWQYWVVKVYCVTSVYTWHRPIPDNLFVSALQLISTCSSVRHSLLTSCSSGTAALAWRPSLRPKHTCSAVHTGMSLRSSPLWLLYLIPLFWIFSVRVRVHVSTCVCVRQNPPLRTPTFLAPPRQAGREWWLKLKMSLYFSLFLFLTLNQ